MKKILFGVISIITLILLTGCGMDNTPTMKVENFLNNYKNLDEVVINQMGDIINIDTMMDEVQKNEYKEILKRQYKDLSYTIKNETIDGDRAVITTEIEVYDFYKVNNLSELYYTTNPDKFIDESGNLVNSKYIDYRLSELKSSNEKIKYTIDFTLRKIDKNWIIDDIDEVTRQKIHGLFSY